MDGHLGCFQGFAISNTTTVNILVHSPWSSCARVSLGYIPKVGEECGSTESVCAPSFNTETVSRVVLRADVSNMAQKHFLLPDPCQPMSCWTVFPVLGV